MSASLAKTHASYSHDWWTPPEWIQWVNETFLGQAWFDPCPGDWDPAAHASGLERRWGDRTYCNHPGDRGSTPAWWSKAADEVTNGGIDLIWCAFNVEQLRHMRPSNFRMPGWLIMPRNRIGFVWGGPDMAATKNAKARKHGERSKQPGNWTVFWSTIEPAPTPEPSLIVRTGV